MSDTVALTGKDDRRLEIAYIDFTEKDRLNSSSKDYLLADLAIEKLNNVTSLELMHCTINPQMLIKLLQILSKVTTLQLEFCICFDSPDDSYPEFERKLEYLTVGLDLNKEDGLLDCPQILLNPKINLPTGHLTVDRFDRGYVEPEDHYDSYLTSYIKRYKKDIKYILFDSGITSLWRYLAEENGIKDITFGIVKDHDDDYYPGFVDDYC